ncbi:MAG: chemotaxis protein CheB [Acidiferrobacteraceae bacterium]
MGQRPLHVLLSRLPKDFPASVVIVQHIAAGFLGGLVERLSGSCAVRIHIAREGEATQARQSGLRLRRMCLNRLRSDFVVAAYPVRVRSTGADTC